MKPFFETTCDKCGVIDEAKFVDANIHVKQICNSCGCYIKFFSKNKLIHEKELKLRIFEVVKGDLKIIEQTKEKIDFPPKDNFYLYNVRLLYWKLYLQICNDFKMFN